MKKITAVLLSSLLCLLTACSTDETTQKQQATPKDNGIVNVYSARHYDTDLELYKKFKEKTGIEVKLVEAKSDALIERILNEGKHSPADLLITVDAGRLFRAEQKGIFSAVNSTQLNQRIPEHLRHPDNLWFGLSKRARVIIYNKALGKPESLENYQDLIKADFNKQICMRSSSNIYNISLLASIVSNNNEAEAEQWAKGIVNNFYRNPQGNDTANIRAVEAGQCRISLVNTYYIARLIAADEKILDKIGIIFPNQATTGTHINISGAGILKYAPNRDNAIKLLEYLTEQEAQNLFVSENHEYPIDKAAEGSSALKQLGTFKEDNLDASKLGEHQATAVKIYDRAGWN